MDSPLAFLLSPEFHSIVLQVLLVASAALPLLEKIASLTATKKDDDLVKALAEFLGKVLPLVPRVKLGAKK